MSIEMSTETSRSDKPELFHRPFSAVDSIRDHYSLKDDESAQIRSMVANALGVEDYALPKPVELSRAERITDSEILIDDVSQKVRIELIEPEVEAYQPITETENETKVRSLKFSAKAPSLSGLRRVASAIKEMPSNAYYSAGVKMTNFQTSITEKLQKDEAQYPTIDDAKQPSRELETETLESKTNRRNKVLIGVGALAISAAVAYAASRTGLHVGSHSQSHEVLQSAIPTKTPNHAVDIIQSKHQVLSAEPIHIQAQHSAGLEHPHAVHRVAASAKYHTGVLKYHGDTIWNHVRERVQAKYGHISQSRLTELTAKFTHKTLTLNHLSSADARHMSLGQKFKISV